ncbi:hypothetical protein lerEdw1_009953 [Lerista edwardsae]|nr:hypothetical protein lerEdw1_009953 [Lerista edwardsae]
MPKVSLPTLGARGGDGQELEAGEAKRRGSWEGLAVGLEATAPKGGATAKAPRFKLPSFGLARSREAGEAPGLEVSAKSTKPPGPPKAEAEQGQLHSQAPALPGRVPQVELPKLGSRGAEAGLAEGLESPGLWARLPVLDLALGGPEGGTAEAGSGGREGGWVMPQGPSLGVSAPRVELGVSLPAVGPVVSVPQGALGAESRIRLPRVELPTFGRGQERGLEAEAQLLGSHRLSFGREEGREAAGGGEGGSLLGAKVRVPAVDLSLPGARLSEVELPLTEREGPEGRFKMPSVGLPKFSTPRVKGPEVALDVGLEVGKGKASGPALPLPKWGGSGSDGEGEAERDLPRLPQLELKAPRPKGGPEGPGLEAKSRAASGLAGSGKAEAEAAVGAEDGRFRLKIPSLSIVKAGPELGTDTQPLCPEAQGGDFSFRVPQLALPGVGFSVEHGGKGEAKGTPAGGAGLEADVGGLEAVLKGPRLQALSSGGGDLEGPRAAFRVPGVELSAPGLRAQAAYDVAGTQLQLEGAGKGGAPGSDGPGGKVGAADVERRPRVRLPKFGLSLPRAGLEASDGALGPEVGGRGKRAAFVLTGPKGRGAEASPGLLEGDEEREGKGVMAKLRRRPAFGLSRSKTKVEAEVNGELEEGAPSRLKVPKLGFSKAEGAAQHNGEGAEEASAALQNGAQDGKATALGKIRLPQVELSSPAKGAETDPELNLNLAPKLRAAKLGFSGLRKRNGEAAPGETGKAAAPGEKAPRFRFPRLALGPKPHGTLESPSGHGDGKAGEAEGLAIRLPSVGFSEEPGSEEQVPAVGGGRGEATAAV